MSDVNNKICLFGGKRLIISSINWTDFFENTSSPLSITRLLKSEEIGRDTLLSNLIIDSKKLFSIEYNLKKLHNLNLKNQTWMSNNNLNTIV